MMRDFVKEAASQPRREYHIYNDINVLIKDFPQSEEVDIPALLSKIEYTLPRYYFDNIDVVYVGEFEDLGDRNAAFLDGAIYMTSTEPTTHDMLENIVHEVAHSLEGDHGDMLYGDQKVISEFLGKRERLRLILEQEGYTIPEEFYEQTEYNRNFDKFLMNAVGYPTLTYLTMGLFVSPYGATSLREYFANAFEHFYINDREDVKKVSPQVYLKIDYLHKTGE